jgi:hypothetical protein
LKEEISLRGKIGYFPLSTLFTIFESPPRETYEGPDNGCLSLLLKTAMNIWRGVLFLIILFPPVMRKQSVSLIKFKSV